MTTISTESLSYPGLLRWREALVLAVIALVYFLAHQIAFLFPDSKNVLMAIWPAGGIGLAAFLLNPRRRWPAIAVTLFVAGNLANLLSHRPLTGSLGFMIANVIESLACAWMITGLCGTQIRFDRVKEVLTLMAAAALVNAFTSCIGAGAAVFVYGSSFWDFWKTWWSADGLGILIIAPLIVSCWQSFTPSRTILWGRMAEVIAFLAIWCLTAYLSIFSSDANPRMFYPYMMIALLIWPALRLGQSVTLTAMTIMAGITFALLGTGLATFPWSSENSNNVMFLTQLYIGCVGVVGMLLASSYAKIIASREVAVKSDDKYRSLVETTDTGFLILDSKGRVLDANAEYVRLSGYGELQEILGRHVTEWTAAHDLQRNAEAVAQCIRDHRIRNLVIDYSGKNGRVTPIEVDAALQCDGESVRIVSLCRDVTERKKAENALREKDEAHSLMISHISDVIAVMGADGFIKYKSPNITKWFGWQPQDLVGTNCWLTVHPDDLGRIQKEFTALLENDNSKVTVEYRYKCKDGSYKPIELTAANLINDRNISGVLMNYRDITDRKLTELELMQISDRLTLATQAGGVGVWDYDVVNNVLIWDNRMYHLYGITQEQFSGAYEAWQAGLHPEDRLRSDEEIQLALRGEKKFDTEFRVLWQDGSVHSIRALAMVQRDADGKPLRMIGTNWDITDRKHAEEKIRTKDLQFRQLSANVPDLIYQFTRRLDGSYIVPIASEGIKNIFGCSPEDVLEDFAPIARVIYPEDSVRVISDIEYSAQHLTVFTCEFRVQIPGKTIQWILSRSKPERLPDGSTTWYGFNADITERKKTEEALQLLSKDLRIKNAEIERFLYAASHDLRTPVVTIQSFMRHLEKDLTAGDTSRIEIDLKFISMSADKIAHRLDDLLEMSRVGKIMGVSSHVTMKDLVNDATNAVAGRISDRGVAIKTAEMDVALYGDRPRLAEIWQNLIENACKFMGNQAAPCIEIGTMLEKRNNVDGGNPSDAGLTVPACSRPDGKTGRPKQPPVKEAATASDPSTLVFFVRDNGIGIEPRHHNRVFDLFERLNPNVEGTGMGLAIVKRIIELYQGLIWVESAGVGQGTCFCFTLPGAIKDGDKT